MLQCLLTQKRSGNNLKIIGDPIPEKEVFDKSRNINK